MGIDPDDRRYNCHHLIERSDYKKNKRFWDSSVPSGRFDIDQVSNLFPVRIEDHEWINQRINVQQGESQRHKKGKRHHRGR